MKDAAVKGFPKSHFRIESDGQDNCTDTLKKKGSNHGTANQMQDAADIQYIKTVSEPAALLEADFTAQKHGNGCTKRDKAETADLYQKKDDKLSGNRPVASGIYKRQTGYAGGACGSKERRYKRRPGSALRGKGKR